MKLLIADDHSLVREGLRAVLTDLIEGVTVIDVANLPDAISAVHTHGDVDLAMLDLNMPGMSGTASISIFCEKCPVLPVIILSGSENPDDVNGALANGAMGYIPKSASPEVMLSAINLVRTGGIYVPALMLTAPNAPKSAPLYTLTPRQLDVLRELSGGKSNKEIARNLNISEGTVKTHIDAILSELNARNRTHAVIIAQSVGLI